MSPAKQSDLGETVKPKTYLGVGLRVSNSAQIILFYFPLHKDGIQQNISEVSMESVLTPASKKSQWSNN